MTNNIMSWSLGTCGYDNCRKKIYLNYGHTCKKCAKFYCIDHKKNIVKDVCINYHEIEFDSDNDAFKQLGNIRCIVMNQE